jgi:hypothetical protein
MLHGAWTDLNAPLQRLLAQPPPLRQLALCLDGLPTLDMAALTQLTYLKLTVHSCGDAIQEGTVLPPRLQELVLGRCWQPHNLEPALKLQCLQRLSCPLEYPASSQLAQLSQLPSLQHLCLTHRVFAYESASLWKKLPLQALHVYGFASSSQEAVSVLCGIAAATTITCLELIGYGTLIPGIMIDAVAACSSISGLQCLQRLHVRNIDLVPGDALALTALTSLTRLSVRQPGCGVHEGLVKALAGSLTNLKDLYLQLQANILNQECLECVHS